MMTSENKKILLKDLCARLPYGVKCNALLMQIDGSLKNIFGTFRGYNGWANVGNNNLVDIETVRPYLRPMSSMTEDEKIELCTISYAPDEMKTIEEKLHVVETNAKYATDFYNEHHFDYRGMIEKGLAIEAPEGMYKTK